MQDWAEFRWNERKKINYYQRTIKGVRQVQIENICDQVRQIETE